MASDTLTVKTRYREFCNTASDLPVFMQPWYLDAVCTGGDWDLAWAEVGERMVAAWPYFLKRKGPWQYIAMPPLARQMGPYLLPEFRTPQKENALLEQMLDQLPKLISFEQDFNYTADNWLPLYWRGYRQTTRYSYLLDINDLDAVWKNLKSGYRSQKIPRAQKLVQVQRDATLAECYRLQQLSYNRQGLDLPLSFELLTRLDAALAAHGQREIFLAVDRETGAAHAAAYLIWDRNAAYYLLAGDDPALRASGASILLIWEAVRFAHTELRVPVFDFAGSMVRSIEHVRRQFGARQQPYFRVWKEWSVLWKAAKRLLNAVGKR